MWELDPTFQEGSFGVDFALSELTCLFFSLGLEATMCKLPSLNLNFFFFLCTRVSSFPSEIWAFWKGEGQPAGFWLNSNFLSFLPLTQ